MYCSFVFPHSRGQNCFRLLFVSSYLVFQTPQENKNTLKFLRKLTGIHRKHNTKTGRKNLFKKQAKRILANCITPQNYIHNLSKVTLTSSQQQILSKGLSFVPTPKPTPMSQIYLAYNKFKRRLLLKHMFSTEPISNTTSRTNPFYVYSSWNPPEPENSSIQQYLADVYKNLSTLRNYQLYTENLSGTEKLSLRELASNPNIVIKPADKGGKIVILDRDAYIREAVRQLSDSKVYTKLMHNPMQELFSEISTFITYLRGKNLIDNNTFTFLHPSTHSRTPVFYMLPKIHKENVPGRPIISGCSSPTANLSIYLDHYLRPIVQQIPSYIKNTTHFIRILKEIDGQVPSNSILVTFDVKSLYTNIPHDEGITCCLTSLEKFYNKTLPLPLRHIKTFLEFIMKKNYFLFNGDFYLQTHGTAMGTPCAPNYANIFMENLEHRILSTAPGGRTPCR